MAVLAPHHHRIGELISVLVDDAVKFRLYVCNTAITTAEAWTAAHWTQTSVGAIFEAIVSGTEANALYHLGFYLDENGDLNQIDDEE